ncbi:MAG: sugar phosphate isomerase/epimerase family protein [Planctomycetota bacterium]|jgi:hypothetical protein
MSFEFGSVSRRKVIVRGLQAGAGVLAVGALSSCGKKGETAKSGPDIRFGFTTYQWGKDWDIPTIIVNCQKAEAFGVELRTSQSYAHGVELDLTPEQREEVKGKFEDSPIELVGLATGERFDSPDPEKVKQAIENAKAFIKLDYDIGGSGVRVFPNSFHKDVPREKTIEQIGKAVNEVGAFAADYGQEVRLEAHGTVGELPSLRAVMDHVTEPSVRVKLNCDKRDVKGEGFEHNFNLVKDLLGYTIHAHDFKDEVYPYQLMMDLLVKNKWSGWILIENSSRVPDRVAALIEQREVFEGMLAKSLGA